MHNLGLTNVIDADERLVIWNDKDKKAEVLDKYYAGIGEGGCQRYEPYSSYQRIESVAFPP